MKRLVLLLALALALPARAAFVERAAAEAALPALPASALAAAPGPLLSSSLSAPALLSPSFRAAAAASPDGPAAAKSPAAAPAVFPAAAAGVQESLPRALESLFARLDADYPLPAASPAAGVRARVRAQLLSAARELDAPEPELLEAVARESDRALARIQRRLDAGEIDPSRTVRLSEADLEPADDAHARIGVYPVAADPFQWGHLLIALRAVGDLGLDKVVFVLAGDDPRKPSMTPVEQRHPMGREVLAAFEPFFAYSPIAVGTTLDGETNVFRILALNPGRRVDAWYMVGDDHYRVLDKKGNPDTLAKLERNFDSALGHSPTLHALKVAFIKREQPAEEVPTSLEVRFLDHVGFDASSTQVRDGRHTLMPYSAYDFARRNDGLYGIAPAANGGEKGGD
ncbi:MAG TPA: hypothetical protein VH309_14495 [Elusimicrobiota bacterium]|jgi:nicotinic acid mononucleotide adenylyltransferase|nr:hypothetical protein [Elusimicrobiota bacterium]